jgi:hypothetical protein
VSLHWQPVGPEPASTYWTRRAVVALVVLVVLYSLVALLTSGGTDTVEQGAGDAAPSPSATPQALPPETAEPTASASPSPSVDVPACADADLAVSAEAERDSYKLGATPTLILTIKNTSDTPCRRDVGQGAAELVVMSGRDRIWSSDDCSPGGEPGPVVLAPQKSDVTRLTWSATRSRPGCEGPKTPIEPGTYVVSARVGELRVQGSAFRVEG